MYLAVDIGGSKTLVAFFDRRGNIVKKVKFATPKKYPDFLRALDQSIKGLGANEGDFKAAAIAAPGRIDRDRGIALDFGNLPWHNARLKNDLDYLVSSPQLIFIENDANLAGLSEAMLVKNDFKKVLYLTISTGIGDGIIVDGRIDPVFADSEPGQMILEFDGKLQKWENFASGRALFKKYGKRASEIDNSKVWKEFVKGIALGMGELIATLTPDVIILGGGVGTHFDKFGHFLKDELIKYRSNLYEIPPIIKAKRPEEAVIYGCYELIKQEA